VIVTWLPYSAVDPVAGEVIVEIGVIVSVDFEAKVRPVCNVAG
jgi:hypothetical protein